MNRLRFKKTTWVIGMGATVLALNLIATPIFAGQSGHHTRPSPQARQVPHDSGVFDPGPQYQTPTHDGASARQVYENKYRNRATRPMLELGRELYREGPFKPASDLLGKNNLLFQHLMVFGDWRTAVAYNDNGAVERTRSATRLNLDIDWKITATERIHAFMRPLDKNGNFTRFDFNGPDDGWTTELDGNLDTLFFEGEVGSILAGMSGHHNDLDLAIAAGLMPLLFQNGIWVEDAFTGVALSVPALNSPYFGISNADITVFAAFDRVSTAAVPGEDDLRLYGATSFVEASGGYWELGYGYVDDPGARRLSYHNLTASFSRRYGRHLSNTVRVLVNLDQNPTGAAAQTADGTLVLMENSLITRLPSTLIPYLNLFAGFDRPQSLARAAGAGGVLKNTGILFETDGLTGFPKLDDTGADTFGGALGVEYLFALNRQIVLEGAVVRLRRQGAPTGTAAGNQYGVGLRLQQPLTRSLILRIDGIVGWRENEEDLLGARLEIRHKF